MKTKKVTVTITFELRIPNRCNLYREMDKDIAVDIKELVKDLSYDVPDGIGTEMGLTVPTNIKSVVKIK